jgi:hypothetical protein
VMPQSQDGLLRGASPGSKTPSVPSLPRLDVTNADIARRFYSSGPTRRPPAR